MIFNSNANSSMPQSEKYFFCWYFIDSTQALYEAGVKIKGTDVPTWISIMSERSVPHLQKGKRLLWFDIMVCDGVVV